MLNTYVNYFEKFKITNTNYQFFSVVDLKLKREYSVQGDESNKLSEQFDELDIPKFLDWFYNSEYNLSMDHENYQLTPDDLDYMIENRSFF